jgi:hypothetical protein
MSIGEAVPLSLEVETQAGRVLAEVAETLLQNFPTTLVEDEALLAQGALPREMAALMFRISRKRLLQECRDRCLAWVDRPTVTGGTLRFYFFSTQTCYCTLPHVGPRSRCLPKKTLQVRHTLSARGVDSFICEQAAMEGTYSHVRLRRASEGMRRRVV